MPHARNGDGIREAVLFLASCQYSVHDVRMAMSGGSSMIGVTTRRGPCPARAFSALCVVGLTAASLVVAPTPSPVEGMAGETQSGSRDSAEVVVATLSAQQLLSDGDLVDAEPDTVYYAGGTRPDQERFGPTAIELDPDGSFWIADPMTRRIIHVDHRGRPLPAVPLPDQVVGFDDLAVVKDSIFILDTASPSQSVVELNRDGVVLKTFVLPQALTTFEEMPTVRATGLVRTLEGEVLLELEDGSSHHRLNTSSGDFDELSAIDSGGASYAIDTHTSSRPGPPASPSVTISGSAITQSLDQSDAFYSYRLLGFSGLGTVHIQVTRAQPDAENHLRLEQHIEDRNGSSGDLQSTHVLSGERGFTYVGNRLAVSPSGDIFELRTGAGSAEIVRLAERAHLRGGNHDPLLISSVSEPVSRRAPVVTAVLMSLPTQSPPPHCPGLIDSHYAMRNLYMNNSRFLTSANISGPCSGRVQPRYLIWEGNYPGVPYKWGGFDEPLAFNWFAGYGVPVGHILDNATLSCTMGVDCSGYVSRVWNLGYKYNTYQLPGFASAWSWFALQPFDLLNHAGSHAMLVNSYGPNGGGYTSLSLQRETSTIER